MAFYHKVSNLVSNTITLDLLGTETEIMNHENVSNHMKYPSDVAHDK